jgi:IrrE N-terminal-like domain
MILSDQHKAIFAKYTVEVPVRLAAMADELGLEVFKSPLNPSISGLIEPSETARSGFRIRINRHELAERQRFTLAHEIGHYVLHRDKIGGGIVDSVMYRSNLSSRYEVEANKFAADLIMPMILVREKFDQLGRVASDEVVIALANYFRVSQAAMRIRLGG